MVKWEVSGSEGKVWAVVVVVGAGGLGRVGHTYNASGMTHQTSTKLRVNSAKLSRYSKFHRDS